MPGVYPLEKLRQFFESGATQTYTFRKEQLKKLKTSILKHEKELYAALYEDLKKSPEETWVTELGLVVAEINAALRNLSKWMRPKKAGTNLLNLPSKSRIMKEPLGVVLIIGPWNYPFQLLINPLVGAIAAGNCAVLKPSEFAPASSLAMKKMIEDVFPPDYILFAEGEGQVVIPDMMNHFSFDHVFYTGSTAVGRIIYKMAADKLIPVTLELGGKSPCVVESDANIRVASRRIALTKFSNAGQMCVAPDFVLVHDSVREKFMEALKEDVPKFYGDKPEENYNYSKIINDKQFDRISAYLNSGKIEYGGRVNKEKLFIEPTILSNVPADATVMNDEIFGPVLPVIGFKNREEALAIINRHPNPLAFYIYSSSKKNRKHGYMPFRQVVAASITPAGT